MLAEGVAPSTRPTAVKPTAVTDTCANETCHGTLVNRKVMHGPAAQKQCLACHKYEDAARHRFRSLPCMTCHGQVVPSPTGAKSIHPPARDNCTGCHDPHGSDVKFALKQTAPELCLSCHKDIKQSLTSNHVVHRAATQEGGCSTCHAAHFSKLPKLQKQLQPPQCLGCHDRPVQAANGRTLTNMAALLKDNPEHHGPIRLGACTACHQPHAGGQANLLSAPYPPEFYAPFEAERYKLCFTCHSADLATSRQATAVTGFTDGNRNLHWLHVNQEKGRTCRACHEVHASRHPFHIRDSVPFGPSGWMMDINYRQTPRGGTCAPGCHGQRSYDHGERARTIPVVALTPRALAMVDPELPKSPTTAPSSTAERGSYPVPAPPFTPGVFPCTTCHSPKLTVNTERRVLRKPHQEIRLQHDEEHRWCLDCHNADNRDVLRSASGAPIPFAESYRLCGQCHGLQYRDWKSGVHGKRTGQWDGRKDYLLCVHCHDPHSPRFKPIAPLPPPLRPK